MSVKRLRQSLHELATSINDCDEKKITFDQLIARACKYMTHGRKEYGTLAIGSLSVEEVQQCLKIKPTKNDLELQQDIQPLPMGISFDHVLSSTQKAFAMSNESGMRLILNILLTNAHDLVSSLPAPGRKLRFGTEGAWSYGPVTLKREGERERKYMLSGRPDYHLWYGSQADTAVNVVVVEAKRPGLAGLGVGQALAYMSIVHNIRKRDKKKDIKVFGLASDGVVWHFLKINEKSEWSEKLIAIRDREYKEVLGVLVHFLHQAAVMSPGHSQQSSGQADE
ncbi:hypothetical protein N7495_001253 [Penicillium taxi]|uniref:uncharacterized protein n=1 Tax=Penicillium taxi TaxID=168475 RepID=UPI002545B82C|nr:uncharacterized protein N7495_001253 [Penicillium taxi]KAJ5908571.1 hypothetical protein N7495_001253 [Penicillium taxi]